MQIAKHKVVLIDYTLTDPSGKVLDSSRGQHPLAYLHGTGNIIPGLERALEGKQAGDAVAVDVAPEHAYGAKDDNLVQEVPRDRFAGTVEVKPGMQFQANTPQGPRMVTVVGVTAEAVRVDANHPLAGMPLHFEVDVREVRDATPEEVSHGHVHGVGGQEH